MSKTKTTTEIHQARSLEDDPVRKASLERRQGINPAANIAQRLLEAVAGGRQDGERSVDTRRRGARRIGGAALALALTTGAVAAAEGVKHVAGELDARHHQQLIQPLKDYQQGHKLPKGMVAVQAGEYMGTATGWVREHGIDLNDTGKTQDLIARVNDQSDLQGDPGVQPTDTFVVPRSELSPQTIDELSVPAPHSK
jgi:hypothetical protein